MKLPTVSPTQAALIFAGVGILGTAAFTLLPSHATPKFAPTTSYSQKQDLTAKVCLSFTNSTACTNQRAKLSPHVMQGVDSFRACEAFAKQTLFAQKAKFATVLCDTPDEKTVWAARCTSGDPYCITMN